MVANVDDLRMSVLVSRTALGLVPLELNDYVDYYIGPQFLGGQVTWDRKKVSSDWVDGEFTSRQHLSQVTENVPVEILGKSNARLAAARAAVLAAFAQGRYTLSVTTGFGFGVVYDCETADVKNEMTGPRLIARQHSITFTVPRRPVPISGG